MASTDDDVTRLTAEVAALERAIEVLHELSTLVRSAQELEPTLYALLTGVTAGVGLSMNRAAIFLEQRDGLVGAAAVGPLDREEADRVWRAIERDEPDLLALYEAGLAQTQRSSALDARIKASTVDPRGQTPMALAFRRGRLVAGEGTDDLGGLLHLPTVLASPLRGADRVRGVLVADRRFTERPTDAVTRQLFDLLADSGGRAVEQAERYERLALEARTDPLTGLGSRRSFFERLEQLAGAATRDGPSVGLLMIDLDDFKRVNDTWGHPAGDAVLREVGRRLLATLRPGEAFRYGGEELAVLLSGVSAAQLERAAERVLHEVTAEPLRTHDDVIAIRCSVGGAVMPGRAEDAVGLVKAADAALLRAKREGKMRVELA